MLKNEIRHPYICVNRSKDRYKNGVTGKIVLQCAEPHLVGQLKVFGPSVTSEAQRIIFERNVPRYLWCREPGTRIYMHIVGTYDRAIPSGEEQCSTSQYASVAREMLDEALAFGFVNKNDMEWFRQRNREEYNYTDAELERVLDDFMQKGY